MEPNGRQQPQADAKKLLKAALSEIPAAQRTDQRRGRVLEFTEASGKGHSDPFQLQEFCQISILLNVSKI